MQYTIVTPNGRSSMSISGRIGGKTPRSCQSIEVNETLSLSVSGVNEYVVSGDLEIVEQVATGLAVKPNSTVRESGSGSGKITVRSGGQDVLEVIVTVGGPQRTV